MDLSTVHQGIQRRKRRKRVGRGPGSGHGKTATRGMKCQNSRSGATFPGPLFEGGQSPLARRVPKRGFNNAYHAFTFAVVNVSDLDRRFAEGATVNLTTLREAGLAKGRYDGVKILGDGDLTKKLTVAAHRFSKSAEQKI